MQNLLAKPEDPRAREAIILSNLPLARRLAMRYRSTAEPFDDLVQVANLGLVKAVDRFDPGRGVAFSSFAVPTILGELRRHIRDTAWPLHVPRDLQENVLKVEAATRQLEEQHGRPPNDAQVSRYLRLPVEDVLEARRAATVRSCESLEEPPRRVPDRRARASDPTATSDGRLERSDARLSIAAAARRLPQCERRVLALVFVSGLTQSRIAELTGGSQMQVSRRLRHALARLREFAQD